MNEKSKKYYDALDSLLDKPIAYNPAFKKITGRTSAAVWLSQVWYWSKRTSNPDGWFYKSARECLEETGLTDNEQMSARRLCIELGVIEEDLRGVPATMHFRLIKPRVYELLGVQFPTEWGTEPPTQSGTGFRRNGRQDPHRAGNFNKNTGNTAENTRESTPPALDFKNMTVGEARKVPTLKLYTDAAEYFPGSVVWEYVHNTITQNNLTFEKIHGAAVEWGIRGYKPENVKGILEWAVNGIPANGKGSPAPAPSTPKTPSDPFGPLVDLLQQQEAQS